MRLLRAVVYTPANAVPADLPPIVNGDRELKVMTIPGQELAWGGIAKGGDDRFSWNSDNPEEVDKAKKAFESYIAQGYRVYKSSSIGGKKIGDPITEFDPNIERMIAVPPMKAG